MATTYTPIATQTITTAVSNITFSSIPNTYTDLVIIGSAQTTVNGTSAIIMKFNSSPTPLWSLTNMQGNGTSATSGRSSTQDAYFYGGNCAASGTSAFSTWQANIFNYANTSIGTTAITRVGIASDLTKNVVGYWATTDAVSSILIGSDNGNLNVGSTFTIYGIKAA